jgi:hypothetical protein
MKRIGVFLIILGLIIFIPVLIIREIGSGGAVQEPSGDYSYQGKVIIELQGNSWPTSLDSHPIQGTDEATLQEHKFKQVSEGEDFHYLIAGLQEEVYDLELSFVECQHTSPGERVFDVYCNGSPLPDLTDLDVLSRAGNSRAYQVTVEDVAALQGMLDLQLKADVGLAMISCIRLLTPDGTTLDIDVQESRHWTYVPLRFKGHEDQDVYEVVLGRFGSRFMVNPMPQILAWRQSPLGTWTEDFSELLLAFRDQEGDIRCLPFTDRYPVFYHMEQELFLSGVSFECRDPDLPFEVTMTITSPFYPQDALVSTAPFFYLGVEISNPLHNEVQGELLLARPHKDEDFGREAPIALDSDHHGYKYTSRYSFGQDSHVIESDNDGYGEFWEAIAVDEAGGVEWHYRDITSTSWIWDSPDGYPLPCSQAVYTFIPRGYSGFQMPFTLAPSGSLSRTVVLACHGSEGVLNVMGEEDYAFIYNEPSPGPDLSSVDEVVDYALGADRAAIEQKTAFFDGILSNTYLSGLPQSGHDLMAYALQSFLCNTWWCHNGSKEWFSVWEGEPYMYHSSVDVEYGNSWFYLYFWPEMEKKLLMEWIIFEKENHQGRFLSHDMGIEHWINGMAYPHDMPVEENADYILLMYNYWKSSGDTAFMKSEFSHIRDYARFIFNCDTDGDGMPDLNVANTIDQGSPAIQNSRNQTYLGVKALAAYQAAAEMARAQDSPDNSFITKCDSRVRLINITLGDRVWLGDHFAVGTDYSVPTADREAYSIYASNGLLYLLASGLDAGITASNLDRFRTDISTAAAATLRRYGFVHTSVHNENQWVSQNLWRDALGYWLEVEGWGEGQEDRYSRYWDLERYYATNRSGGFWDVCAYNHNGGIREGVVRGAFSPDYAYDQSLGYYCRGVAALSLVEAQGRLRLDRPAGLLTFHPDRYPCRVPVLRCADWGAEDPEKRIPVLIFDEEGRLAEVLNPHLLP